MPLFILARFTSLICCVSMLMIAIKKNMLLFTFMLYQFIFLKGIAVAELHTLMLMTCPNTTVSHSLPTWRSS